MLLRVLFTASLALLTTAAPTATSTRQLGKREAAVSSYDKTPELAAFYAAVSKEIANIKNKAFYQQHDVCNMTRASASFPTAPTPLPSPDTGAQLKHVLLGTGTQNYTCPTTVNATAAPTAIGAFARLFNVSCIAANYPDILAQLPVLAYQYKLPSVYFPAPGTVGLSAGETPGGDYSMQPLNVLYSGLHTFEDLTTPRFNLSVGTPGFENGWVLSKKVANSTAWTNATKGANGAVPYLKLDAKNGTSDGYTNVYRMMTQGGMQPKTCGQQTGEFEVPYTALYYFYGK